MTPEQYERLVKALEKIADAAERRFPAMKDSVTYTQVDRDPNLHYHNNQPCHNNPCYWAGS